MPIRIFDQTVGQTAGLSIPTTGKGAITNDGLEAYAQVTVTASGQPVIGDAAGEGNVVGLSGATISSGSISFSANLQTVTIDTYGFGGAAFTISGFGTATLQVQWSNLTDSGFIASDTTNIGTGSSASTITGNGQYTASSGGRYMRIATSTFTTGPIVVTPVLLTGGLSSGGGGGGGGDVNLIEIDGNSVNVGAGTVGTGTQRMTLGSDDPAVVSLAAIETSLGTPATELPKTPLMTTSDLTRVFDSGSTVAEASLVSATASQTTKGYIITVTSAGAGYIELRDGSAGTVLMRIDFPAAGGWVFDLNERPWVKTTANTALYWYRSAAVAMTIDLRYVKSA